jgi:hypothetical protein
MPSCVAGYFPGLSNINTVTLTQCDGNYKQVPRPCLPSSHVNVLSLVILALLLNGYLDSCSFQHGQQLCDVAEDTFVRVGVLLVQLREGPSHQR